MNAQEYKEMVIRTEVGTLRDHSKIVHALVGMNGEAGECVDIIKKTLFQGHSLDRDHLLSELGDVCWYTMLLISELNLELKPIFDETTHHRILNPFCEAWDGSDKEYIDNTYGLDYILDLNRNCGDAYGIVKYWRGNTNVNIIPTLRNIFYNIRMTANIFGFELEDIFNINDQKIKSRYPKGFSCEKSINRNDSF